MVTSTHTNNILTLELVLYWIVRAVIGPFIQTVWKTEKQKTVAGQPKRRYSGTVSHAEPEFSSRALYVCTHLGEIGPMSL